MAGDRLATALSAIVGERHVLTAPDLRASYETDWTGRFTAAARLVVRPADTGEVSAVLAACAEAGAAVVPQGGNTGLVGASVPRGGEVVLSLARLSSLGAVDEGAGQLDAGAGATLASVQDAAARHGLDAGIDFAARDSATIGGLIATDAGGMRALRHGTMRARVAGVEAVLADGGVVDRRTAVLKDNAGLDLGALLVGSEGTLGIVTRARLRLVPRLDARVAALVPLEGPEAAVALMAALRRHAPSLDAADFFLDEGLTLVLAHLRLPAPVPERAPAYLVVECAAAADPTDELAAALEAAGAGDAAVADDTAGRARLWRFREAHTEAIAAQGVPLKLDVGVPLDRLAGFLRTVPGTVAEAAPGARAVLFGHLGDGNVHVNVLGAAGAEDAIEEAVLRLAAAAGGTISAEHGIGVVKARWLGLVRTPADLAAMAAVKRALDPRGILNPGAVLPAAAAGRDAGRAA